ncbi:MAG: DUF4126 domain-containing protein [Betaproteobacteria bacterium]|nr:DUF4126 domain-containing protein [Betaproteobacteria bacterium]
MNELTPYILAAALAWASGIRLYAALFIIGLAHRFGWISLPQDLQILSHGWVLSATGLLLLLEFFVDKVPAIDSAWDALHTFIRIPAGALLAAGVIAPQDGPAWALVAGLLGGTITAGTHFTKAGGRALVNTSPEPLSNWSASFLEDGLVIFGLWLAWTHPLMFGLLLLLFLLLIAWLLPKLWRGVVHLMTKITQVIGLASPQAGKEKS